MYTEQAYSEENNTGVNMHMLPANANPASKMITQIVKVLTERVEIWTLVQVLVHLNFVRETESQTITVQTRVRPIMGKLYKERVKENDYRPISQIRELFSSLSWVCRTQKEKN